jgi:hypothetical protein
MTGTLAEGASVPVRVDDPARTHGATGSNTAAAMAPAFIDLARQQRRVGQATSPAGKG